MDVVGLGKHFFHFQKLRADFIAEIHNNYWTGLAIDRPQQPPPLGLTLTAERYTRGAPYPRKLYSTTALFEEEWSALFARPP